MRTEFCSVSKNKCMHLCFLSQKKNKEESFCCPIYTGHSHLTSLHTYPIRHTRSRPEKERKKEKTKKSVLSNFASSTTKNAFSCTHLALQMHRLPRPKVHSRKPQTLRFGPSHVVLPLHPKGMPLHPPQSPTPLFDPSP